jgi:hypothetical protein
VEHVGVGEDQVGGLPDQGTFGAGGIAVVHGGPDLGKAEVPDLPKLVPGQGLGREQVQRRASAVLEGSPGEGQVVHQGLPAGRAGGHDHVPAPLDQLQGPALVGVEALHAEEPKAIGERSRQVWERLGIGVPSRELFQVDQPATDVLVRQQFLEEPSGVHAHDVPTRPRRFVEPESRPVSFGPK